jgi:hypothetical protein
MRPVAPVCAESTTKFTTHKIENPGGIRPRDVGGQMDYVQRDRRSERVVSHVALAQGEDRLP